MSFRNLTVATLLAIATAAGPAAAQMSNQPYNFPRSGGLGMSNAAKQAIINQELFGRTPDNIIRFGGELVTVEEGPGSSAIARREDGSVIPGFRGRADFRAPGAFAGSFNAYFAGGGDASTALYDFGGGSISDWTLAVFRDDAPIRRLAPRTAGGDSIDAWTAQVDGL